MATIKFISIGTLKEEYLREAVSEYSKRLSGFCTVEHINLKETKISQSPSENEIKRALDEEAKQILSAIPQRSYKVALCIEGKQFASTELAEKIENAFQTASEICFVIGSSHGLSDEVKAVADLKLSVSKMTFPHQLMRVILLEGIYRSMSIIKGTKYHK